MGEELILLFYFFYNFIRIIQLLLQNHLISFSGVDVIWSLGSNCFTSEDQHQWYVSRGENCPTVVDNPGSTEGIFHGGKILHSGSQGRQVFCFSSFWCVYIYTYIVYYMPFLFLFIVKCLLICIILNCTLNWLYDSEYFVQEWSLLTLKNGSKKSY